MADEKSTHEHAWRPEDYDDVVATIPGIDSSQAMLEAAQGVLPGERATLLRRRLEDELPKGPFDLVVSALAVHHLDAAGKRDLFSRVADALTVRGRFVLADVVVPADPADARVELEEGFDLPGTVDEQVAWLTSAGLDAYPAWVEGDLAVIVARKARP